MGRPVSEASEGKSTAHTNGNGNGHGFDNGIGHEKTEETPITTVTIEAEQDCMLKGWVNGIQANVLIDTGAAAMLISKELWDRCGGKMQLESAEGRKLIGVQGTPLTLHGTAQISLELHGEPFSVRVLVVDKLEFNADQF